MPRSSDKNTSYKYRTIARTCYGANIIYLILHFLYLAAFLVAKAYILVYIDAGIILLYGAMFLVIKNRKYYPYALICGNTFFAFIAVSTILLGFKTGFGFYLIGLCIVSFFTTYFSKSRSVKGSIIWVSLSLAIFLTLYYVTRFNPPYYEIDQWLEMTLFTAHSIGVFAFIAIYLIVFLKYAFSLEKRIKNESRTDELTQINNRYGLYDYLDAEKDKSGLLLALFDIDDFKDINDRYGHVAGDHILKRVAEITTEVLTGSFVCRYGGEEFVAVLKEDENSSFFDRLEELRIAIEKEVFVFEKDEIKTTITIGANNYVKGLSLDAWIELADKKMYSGKNAGKNQTVI